jgi:hypothetical protein
VGVLRALSRSFLQAWFAGIMTERSEATYLAVLQYLISFSY